MKVNDENSRIRIQDPDPDPHQNVMDPEHCLQVPHLFITTCSPHPFTMIDISLQMGCHTYKPTLPLTDVETLPVPLAVLQRLPFVFTSVLDPNLCISIV